jgi:hypothetical protein
LAPQAKAKAAEEVPGLRRNLSAARQSISELKRRTDSLEQELISTRTFLKETQAALEHAREERETISKEAASAEAASEELVERLNADNSRLEVKPTPMTLMHAPHACFDGVPDMPLAANHACGLLSFLWMRLLGFQGSQVGQAQCNGA